MSNYCPTRCPAADFQSVRLQQQLRQIGQQLRFERGAVIYAQGERGQTLYLVESGRVKLTVVSAEGSEVTLALIGPGMLLGESCLASHRTWRRETACALTGCKLVCLKKPDIDLLLARDHEVAASFITLLMERNCRFADDLLDHLLNSSERRLARALLLLAYSDAEWKSERTITGISHETLAGLIGTTRPRVSCFMATFRKRGWIDYNRREIIVHPTLRDRLTAAEPLAAAFFSSPTEALAA